MNKKSLVIKFILVRMFIDIAIKNSKDCSQIVNVGYIDVLNSTDCSHFNIIRYNCYQFDVFLF